MANKIQEKIKSLLSEDKDGELRALLERIIEWEKNHPPRNEYDGFYWHEVYGDPRVLNKLVTNQILKVVLRTNSGTAYRLIDLETTENAIKSFRVEETELKPEGVEIPENVFDIIIGHEDKKEIILRALKSPKRTHILLYGSPASAKSLILECLSRLPGAKYIIGSSSTKAGLFDLLYNEEPSLLILDEIDKMDNPQDLAVLLSLMETGRISETKYGRRRVKTLTTKVIAAANKIDKLPPELLSRFIKMRFHEYTDEEFMEVATKVLEMRENISSSLAIYIADQVLRRLKSRDVRDCIKVARLLREQSRKDVDNVINILSKQ